MNTYLSRLCSLAFVVLVLSACGGGGGGGGGGGTPTAKTTPTTITVIDGYIKGAVVCVDKNKNGSCDSGETKGETGPNGKVTLDIPLEDVGKYPIVAYIPADAIDLDNPSAPVGKAYTMAAPADQSAIVSPLSTLVKRLIDKDGKTTAQASLQISSTVGDPSIDYIQSKNAQARMAAKMLAELMQDPSKLLLPSNTTDAQKQAAMADAMLDVLPYIQSKAQNLSASMSACASDIGGAGCQEAVAKALSGVMQTASITGASSSNTPVINSGGRTDSLAITLSGTYSGNALGSDYSIRVMDGGSTLGTATLAADINAKRWSFTTATLTAGSHDFKAVVVRNSDSIEGSASSLYTVKLGNSVIATGSSNVLDTITLTLSNLWSNVKSVVFGIPDSPSSNIGQSDLVDGQTSKTLTAPISGLWSNITTVFKTTGNKIITLVFKDQANQEVDRSSINVNIATGTVSQTANISSIKDQATPTANEIVAGQVTKYTKPVISGTVDVSLSQYYDVAVFDNGTKLAGQLVYTNNRKDWSFTPASALSQGEHTITAGVVRIDGVEGPKDIERKFVLLLSNIGFSPANPQLGLPVSFSASNIWSNITTVLWNFGDGVTLRDFTYEGRSNVQHTFAESSGVGNKTVTVSYVDNTGKTVGTEQLVLNLGAPPVVAQLATITTIKDGNNILQSGDWASSNLLSLQGTYQGELGPGFTVEIIVDGMDWDTASIDPATHTWTSTKHMPWYGMLNIQVVVKQHIQTGPFADVYKEYFGIYSEPFKVKIGNKLTPSSTQLSTWDEWVLTLSNVWRNVRTAVITFVADASDMVDGLVTRTLSGIDPMYMQQRGQSLSISAGFRTTGDKAVNIAYLDGNGQTVSTDSVRLTVNAAGAVTQIPTVDAITSIANQPIEKNGSTRETVSSVDGSLSAAIGKFYYVEVYDNGSNTALPGTMSYNENRTRWTFTPSAPLAIGSHALTAAVVRGDGVSGARSVSAWNFTLTQPRLIKIGANGTAFANQNAQWSDTGNEVEGTRWDCILEFDTGRMWEVKPKSPNQLRSADFTFTYYIPNPRVAGSWVGSETTNGSCNSLQSGKKCNTQNYIEAVNSVGLCGKKDWRLPTQTDVAQQVKGFPKLYFPNLTWFWIESDTPTYGWYVEAYSTVQAEVGPFTYGSDDANDVAPVILVRNSR